MRRGRRAALAGALLAWLLAIRADADVRPVSAVGTGASVVPRPSLAPRAPRRPRAATGGGPGVPVRARGPEREALRVRFAMVTGAGAGAADTAPEPVIIELQLGRLVRTAVQAYRVRTEVLIPLSQFFQLAEVRHSLSPEGRLEATLDPGNRRIVIDVRRDSMEFGERRVRLEPEFRWAAEGGTELYVGAERLGDLLGLRFVVDWADLTATVVDPAALPIARRRRREAAREAYLRHIEGPRPDVSFGLERPRWDGVVMDYSLFSSSTDPLAGAAYALGLGADLLGGSFELGAQSVGRAEDGEIRVDASWTGVWRENPWVKQLQLGDGAATGPLGRSLRGVVVTNAPFVRPSLVGALRYDGRLEAGWAVEAYRGGDLVAFDSTDALGGFAIDLPVRYGENPVDFVAYGPFGEIREFNRTYRVLAELLPPRRFEYGVSVGQCRGGGLCDATANADVRYGVSRRWTLQTGLDQFWRDTLADRLHPYAAVVANPANAWALEGELVGRGVARGAARYEPSVDLRLEADYGAFSRDSASVFVPAGRRAQWSVGGFVRPSRAHGFFFFDGRLEQVRTAAGTATRTRLGASVQTAEIRFLPYVRTERDSATSRSFAGLNTFVLPRPTWGGFLSQVLLRTAAEVERRAGLSSWSAFAARPVAPGLRVEVGATWQRGAAGAPSGVTYALTLSSYLPAVRAVTAVTLPPGQDAVGTQFVQGSVLWDRGAGRVNLAPGPALERSGLSGRVFLDENANGRYDAGEPGLPDVRVLVGAASARTDSSGAYRVWDLVPFEPVLVTVDSLSLESPLLVPAFARVSIVPGPNRYRRLDVPVVTAGVIEGRVVRDGRGVGGLTLVLTDRRSGAHRTLVTFTDGGFYLMGVKPGEYELTVAPAVLDVLGVDANPLPFTLAPTPAGVARSDLELRLTPRR